MLEKPKMLTVVRNSRRPTDSQIAAFQGVPTGFVVDALWGAGALSAAISPIGEGRDLRCVAAGPALTADNGPGDVLATLAALEFIQPGDVLIAAVGGHQGCAAVGDRVAGMVKNCGGIGLVTDGPARDYQGIIDVGLPLWCTGLTPGSPYNSGPGRIGFPVNIGGQQIESGDMVVADRDGVVVVPFAQIDAVIAQLEIIQHAEAEMDAKVVAGLKISPWVKDLLNSDDTAYVDE